MDKCLNVVVYYNNEAEVEAYIKNVNNIGEGLVDICVVINSDKKGFANKLITRLKNELSIKIYWINYGKNVGYLNALLITIKNYCFIEYKYYILSNTDICYVTKEFFKILLFSSYKKNIGCIAPSIYSSKTKSFSNPHYMERIPYKKMKRNIFIFSHPFIAKTYLKVAEIKSKILHEIEKESDYVYSPHGCYMIFTQKFISEIKGYEYGVKLYSEESCVGELLRKCNMSCYYDSSIKVLHDESKVTGTISNRKRFSLWTQSLRYIVEKFYN